jgi:hypothetical protein
LLSDCQTIPPIITVYLVVGQWIFHCYHNNPDAFSDCRILNRPKASTLDFFFFFFFWLLVTISGGLILILVLQTFYNYILYLFYNIHHIHQSPMSTSNYLGVIVTEYQRNTDVACLNFLNRQ